MKVIGTGAPEVLTTRFERCELDPLRTELREQRAIVMDALAHETERQAITASEARTEKIDELHAELLTISRVLDQVEQASHASDAPVEVIAPTALMAQVLRGAALEAVERLHDTLRAVFEAGRRLAPEDVRAAACMAHASVDSLCDYYFVDNHGLDD